MGNSASIQKINYEDIQYIVKCNNNTYVMINTLNDKEQHCLIPKTININDEEAIINKLIKTCNKNIKLIIYGKNCNDDKLQAKYNQLTSLGFYNVYVYPGGLFEWLMLQDIYGSEEFPTTKKELDILKYRPNKLLNIQLLEY
jgi:rhodanese-related sulfurtransferase